MQLRNEARVKKKHSNTDMQYYKDVKSLVETNIYYEKRAYFIHCINSNVKDSVKFWKKKI